MKHAAVAAVALVFLALPLVPSASQVDLSKVLVGKWEGEIEGGRTGEKLLTRTLVIEEVRREDGRWICKAKFGRPRKRLASVDVELEAKGSNVFIRFVTRRGTRIDMELYKERSLVGTAIKPGGRTESTIRLRKVE